MNVWSLCILPLTVGARIHNWEDVGFSLGNSWSSGTIRLGDYTGCQITGTTIKMTCKDRKESGITVPSNVFHSVIDCHGMNEHYDVLDVKPDPSCWKFTFTQETQEEQNQVSSGDHLELRKGQRADVMCIRSPFGPSEEPVPSDFPDHDQGYTTVAQAKLIMTIRDTKTSWKSRARTYPIGTVKVHQIDTEVESSACQKAVKNAFDWKLILGSSKQNVHDLWWTSKPQRPRQTTSHALMRTLSSEVAHVLRDVRFVEIYPKVTKATPVGVPFNGSSVDLADAVKLDFAAFPPKDENPWKHKEAVEMMVDATKLPKGTSKLEVEILYHPPDLDPYSSTVVVPVQGNEVDDDEKSKDDAKSKDQDEKHKDGPAPDKKVKESGGLGPAFWIIMCILLIGGAIGAFLYRRHLLIQAHAREVLP